MLQRMSRLEDEVAELREQIEHGYEFTVEMETDEPAVPRRTPVKLVTMLVGAFAVMLAGAGPLWSSSTSQATYLRNPPTVIERISHEDGHYFVRVFRRERTVVNEMVSSREITADQVQAEEQRILAGI